MSSRYFLLLLFFKPLYNHHVSVHRPRIDSGHKTDEKKRLLNVCTAFWEDHKERKTEQETTYILLCGCSLSPTTLTFDLNLLIFIRLQVVRDIGFLRRLGGFGWGELLYMPFGVWGLYNRGLVVLQFSEVKILYKIRLVALYQPSSRPRVRIFCEPRSTAVGLRNVRRCRAIWGRGTRANVRRWKRLVGPWVHSIQSITHRSLQRLQHHWGSYAHIAGWT